MNNKLKAMYTFLPLQLINIQFNQSVKAEYNYLCQINIGAYSFFVCADGSNDGSVV